MPVFEGPQGIKKSSALQVLGGPWYSIAHESVNSKDFLQGLRGVWLLEIAELQSFSKADITAVKNMLSAPQDDYRPSYGRAVIRFPRQCVMAGTTNADDWGTDDTGLRRFWPIRCGPIALDALRRDRDQLVAEAVARLDAGARWWDMPATTAEIQRDRQHYDEWTRPILDWCRLQPTTSVALKDILAGPLHIPIDRSNKADQMRAARVLKLAGWVREKKRIDGQPAWVWSKEDT
jgi:putative DNA primase/helicase